jgi:hypothetical protein
MPSIVHARLDKETERMLRELERRTGKSHSDLIRQGIKALSGLLGTGRNRTVVGLGRFRSGKSDLGSNKAHLKGFGS